MTEGFKAWLDFSQIVPQMPIGLIVNGGTGRDLTPAEIAAYDAPFPDESYKEGARQFPMLVPVTPEHASVAENQAAWKVLERVRQAVPHRLQRRRRGDPRRRGGLPGPRAGRQGPAARDPVRRPLPAGGQPRRDRRPARRHDRAPR